MVDILLSKKGASFLSHEILEFEGGYLEMEVQEFANIEVSNCLMNLRGLCL